MMNPYNPKRGFSILCEHISLLRVHTAYLEKRVAELEEEVSELEEEVSELEEREYSELQRWSNSSRIISKDVRYEVLKRQNWRCNNCGDKLKFNKWSKWGGEVAHIDHIHPYADRLSYPNGIDNISEMSNLQALCRTCNINKSDSKQ
jgi:5-methylcytosine-specific restriction endonuclease McrA